MELEKLISRPADRKTGVRAEAVDRRIREQFIAMLKKRPIEKISVAALCEKCGINRSTFYRHYEDLYLLLASITEEAHSALFYDVLEKVNLSDDFYDVGYRYILEVCTATEANKELYQMLLFGKTPTDLRERMIESACSLYEQAHDGPSNFLPAKYASLHYRFLVSGLIGVWLSWLRDDCKPEKEILAQEVREEINGFYNNMSRLYGRENGT